MFNIIIVYSKLLTVKKKKTSNKITSQVYEDSTKYLDPVFLLWCMTVFTI